MAKREFVMLAHTMESGKSYGIGGWYYSEKLDGERCYWDGGISRGLPKNEVPWANVTKDERYVSEQVATGLWTRYGNVIHAPGWWLDKLPRAPLDGELWCGRNSRQELRRIVSRIVPDAIEWEKVKYACFGMPSYSTIFANGIVDNPNYYKVFRDIPAWVISRVKCGHYCPPSTQRFETTYVMMKQYCTNLDTVCPLMQYQLPFHTSIAVKILEQELEKISESGGEGLIVRDPNATWIPERAKTLLKMKKLDDAEGTVVGYVAGRETEKGSKLLGMMGAMILDFGGKRLELSGFTEQERTLDDPDWAIKHPGEELPDNVGCVAFPRGTIVTFQYRGMSEDGIPQEARYWRKA